MVQSSHKQSSTSVRTSRSFSTMVLDDETKAAINYLWVLVAGIFCFFLAAGFGLLEAGSVREKNVQNILLKNIVDSCVTVLIYWACGFAFAYGEGNSFIGLSHFFLRGYDDYIFWFFQMVFAGTTATVVSGAVAERIRFRAYMVYTVFLSGFIYPVASHWIWSSQGFLYGKVLDFAGSGAVHLLSGAAAMAASMVLGPRIGKFVKDPETGKIVTMVIPGHSALIAALGTFILWMGFFAFNGASCAAFFCPNYTDTGRIVAVTAMAGSAGGLTLLFYGSFRGRGYNMQLLMNGLLSGLVSSCSGCNVYAPWAAIPVGALGALACNFQIYLFENVFHIDDPVGASAIHMGAGIVGVLAPGFFASSKFTTGDAVGVFYGGSGKQLLWQFYHVLINFTWPFFTVGAVFMALRMAGMLRVSEEVELMGMDVKEHGGPAYSSHKDAYFASIHPIKMGKLENKTQDASEESDGNAEIEKKQDEDKYDEFVASIMDGDADGVRMRKVSGMTLRDGAQ